MLIQGLKGYMTLTEFRDLVEHIQENHSFMKCRGKSIKYITPIFDTRTNKIFCINLRRSGGGLDFSITNDGKTKSLDKWVRTWLEEGDWESTEVKTDVEA